MNGADKLALACFPPVKHKMKNEVIRCEGSVINGRKLPWLRDMRLLYLRYLVLVNSQRGSRIVEGSQRTRLTRQRRFVGTVSSSTSGLQETAAVRCEIKRRVGMKGKSKRSCLGAEHGRSDLRNIARHLPLSWSTEPSITPVCS